MGKGHCLVLEGESVGKRGLHTSLAHTAQMRNSHIQKTTYAQNHQNLPDKRGSKSGKTQESEHSRL